MEKNKRLKNAGLVIGISEALVLVGCVDDSKTPASDSVNAAGDTPRASSTRRQRPRAGSFRCGSIARSSRIACWTRW